MLKLRFIFVSLFAFLTFSFASSYDMGFLNKQAESGDVSALYQLGFIYENGKGIEVDINKAIEFYQKAADLGHNDSLFALELLEEINSAGEDAVIRKSISNNVEVKQTSLLQYSNNNHLEMLKKYANSGDANAEYKLGIIYDNGYGVPRDYSQAINWYQKAADKGHKDALLAVELLSEIGN